MQDPTKRFSDRVENYAKYRPSYPADLYELLLAKGGLASSHVIADLGSGTGLLTQLFLDHGHTVYGVEPNAAMRTVAETLFADQPLFISIDGRAEDTGLAGHSVDYIVAGQAFHWFEPAASKREMRRILRPGGTVALVWNQRVTRSAFQAAYERLLDKYGTDFKQVDQQRVITPEVISAFFAPQLVLKFTLPNAQRFDLEGLRGRLLSSSYTPRPCDANYEPMLAALGELFAAHQKAGFVDFTYTTSIYIGTLP